MGVRRFLVVALAAGAVLLGVVPADAAPPPVAFAGAANYWTGGFGGASFHETGTIAADVNGDGWSDVIVASYITGLDLKVMLNRGNGTFNSPGISVPVGFAVSTVQAGHLDGDGRVDLVVTDFASVKVLRGNGNGTFTAGATYAVLQGGQEDAVLKDFTGDGRLDLAVLTRYGVQMLLGNGNATFTVGPVALLPALGGSSIDDANLNGDGVPDLVVSDAILQQVYALRGNGNGTFALTGTGLSALVPATALALDLNRDGLDDVVALTEANVVLNGSVLINNGAGGFALPTLFDAGLAPVSGDVADFNRDGLDDVVASDTVGSVQIVLLNDGAGHLVLGGKYPVATFPQTPAAADFDRDGRVDIATVGLTSIFNPMTRLSVLRNLTSP